MVMKEAGKQNICQSARIKKPVKFIHVSFCILNNYISVALMTQKLMQA
jgi:hypothetical protein